MSNLKISYLYKKNNIVLYVYNLNKFKRYKKIK